MKRAVIILLALSVCATVVAAMRSPAPSSHVTTAVAPSTTETATGAVARAIAAVDPGLAASSVRSEARRRRYLHRGDSSRARFLDLALARPPRQTARDLDPAVVVRARLHARLRDERTRGVRGVGRGASSRSLPLRRRFGPRRRPRDVHRPFRRTDQRTHPLVARRYMGDHRREHLAGRPPFAR